MKINNIILMLFLAFSWAYANKSFQANSECKECHPTIYKEHQSTMHNKANIYNDPIHKAVWDKHPLKKKGKYKCAKCHTPGADNLEEMMGKGTKGVPDINNPTHMQGVSCAYCHRIESIKPGDMANINVINKEEKDYFGTMKSPVRNKFHYTATNDNFRSGQVCMGCHSHKKNKAKLKVCETQMGETNDAKNCVTCHMPKVAGSVSTKEDGLTHSFHGFPGTSSNQEMLAKYVDIKITAEDSSFEVSIHNQSPHDLMLQPLRLAELRVSVTKGNVTKELKVEKFIRIIGKNGKPSPPWLANEIVKNSMIKGEETRLIIYSEALEVGDVVTATLGYFLVNPKILVKFALENDKRAKKFYILKKITYIVK